MRNLSSAFRRAWYYGEARQLCFADVTLEDGTELNFTNENIWAGGFGTDDAVSDDNSFTALGSAIIGSASLTINNLDETYSQYDFLNASVIMYVGMELPLPDNSDTYLEKIRVGTYHVDDPHYNGATITLELLDNMEQFDRPYTTTLTYPATLAEILRDACQKCNVTLATQSFPRSTYSIAEKPDGGSTTYRDVISWISAIAGCFARCNALGQLELKWFDIAHLEQWDSGDSDGGTFNPWNNPANIDGGTFNPWNNPSTVDGGQFTDPSYIHYISSLYSQDICVDDTIITGVRILVKDETEEDSANQIKEYKQEQSFTGVPSYLIEISDNPFITTNNVNVILNALATQLIGVKFRKVNISHKSDVSIEAGDVAIVWDRKGREYPILVTHTSFEIGASQSTVCGSETPARNKSTRFTNSLKNYVENRKALMKERTAWQAAEEDLARRIANAGGLYQTDVTSSSGTIHYLHNKPQLNDSDIRIVISDVGVTMTANGTAQTPTWYGLTVDGTMIANIMNTIGINFDWGTGGTLTLGGQNNVNGLLRVLDASGNQCGQWSNDGINISKGSININDGRFSVSSYGNVAGKSLEINDHIILQGSSRDDTSKLVLPFGYRRFSYDPLPGKITLDKNGFLMKDVYDETNNYFRMFEVSTGQNKQFGVRLFDVTTDTLSQQLTAFPNNFRMELGSDSLTPYYATNIFPYKILAQGKPDDDKYYVCSFDVSNGRNHISGEYLDVIGNLQVDKNLYVLGTKNRIVDTEDYGERLLYCYETPSPMFGDIGEGVIGEDGRCFIPIDPTFAETISTVQYQVFLQKYGSGECYVSERKPSYFIAEGTPDLSFGWEIKAKQRDYEQQRLDTPMKERYSGIRLGIGSDGVSHVATSTVDYGNEAINHIEEINKERMDVS